MSVSILKAAHYVDVSRERKCLPTFMSSARRAKRSETRRSVLRCNINGEKHKVVHIRVMVHWKGQVLTREGRACRARILTREGRAYQGGVVLLCDFNSGGLRAIAFSVFRLPVERQRIFLGNVRTRSRTRAPSPHQSPHQWGECDCPAGGLLMRVGFDGRVELRPPISRYCNAPRPVRRR